MIAASIEQCKRLYDLSGWIYELPGNNWWHDDGNPHLCNVHGWPEDPLGVEIWPAYPIGYILENLPSLFERDLSTIPNNMWRAGYNWLRSESHYEFEHVANTPEEAVCGLAILLFEKGILKK